MSDRTIQFRGRGIHFGQLYELAMAWRPVVGVDVADLKRWKIAADLTEGQTPRTEAEWRELAQLVDRWVRSPEGRAYASDERGPAIWEEHVRGFEIIDHESIRLFKLPEFADLKDASPPIAQSLDAIADLHPWVAWMYTANRAFPTDVVPRVLVRMDGVFAHAQHHHPAWSWDRLLRDGGVDPLGDPAEQAPRALTIIREQAERARG